MTNRVRLGAWLLLACVLGVPAAVIRAAQDKPLTTADVMRLIAARVVDGVIVTTIETAKQRTFDLSVDGVITLKQAGASDTVIAAMQKAAGAGNPAESRASGPGGAATQP